MAITVDGKWAEMRRRAGLYSATEVARMIGVGYTLFRYHLEQGRISKPTVVIGNGKRMHYQREDIEPIRRYFNDKAKYQR